MHHGVTMEAQPFVTATAAGARDGVSGDFVREDLNPDAGLNLRLGFSSYALDATMNPDFSQVESDEGQVTVNERFALFFPEKRPFFLEGIELFGSPQTLVYTRRIVNPEGRRQVHRQVRPAGRGPPDRRRPNRRVRRLVQHHPAAARLRAQFHCRGHLHQPGSDRQPQSGACRRLPLCLGTLLHPVSVWPFLDQHQRLLSGRSHLAG